MAELEIDQSNLPCVREVCQCFAVLEDGALAHNLQEQEIEQYYSTNIQKNQLVQNDIRVAKRLQDEEEEQQAQQRDIFRQASKQQEEQDFEFARVIQDEIQRSAEEARRREQDDEEIAKQLQEEEEQRMRVTSRGQEGHSAGSTNESVLLSPHQHTLSSLQGRERCSSTTTGWHYSTSYNHSDVSGTRAVPTRGQQDQKITTSRSNEGHVDSSRQFRDGLREPLSEDSEDSDTVFSEQLSLWSQRVNQRRNTAPSQRRASFRYLQEKNYKSLYSRSSFTDELRRWKEEGEEWDEEYCDDGHYGRERGSLVNQNQERGQRDCEGWYRRRDQDRDPRMVEIKERRCSRSESVKLRDRSGHNNRDLVRTWSHNDNPDKRVHFQDDTRSLNRQPDESRRVWEMLGQVLRERGVPVTFGGNGAPLQIRPQSRDSQVLHGSEVSYGSSHQHQRDFHRAAATRHSFHGDIRKRRRSSHRENSGRDHREDQGRHCDEVEHNEEVYGISSRDWHRTDREGRGSRGWREHRYPNDDERERNPNYHKVKRTTSEHRHWHNTTEQRLRSEEQQEVERRVEWPPRRAPQRSQSLSSSSWASTRDRSRHMTAGVSLQRDSGETSLDLGELEQVLHDEELARKLQKEEEKLSSRTSQPSPRSSYPEGDFRVAQVAQDEEIARFMQKQEMKSKRRSRELEGPASWREHRAMMSHHDRRAARERQVQRERLDSEGLPSTTEDCCPENQPPSPHSTYPQSQLIRNIAEELDPTFQARRQDTERLQVDQTDPGCQSLPIPQSGVNDLLVEHAFIPPTKRQPEKSGRTKPKEKKENCKQQ